MQIAPRGVLAAFIIAPAFAAGVCVLGMMIHFVVTDPQGAVLPVGALLPMAGRIWLGALIFAYPAGLAFTLLWLGLASLRLAGAGAIIAGALAGFGAVAIYLDRLNEGGVLQGLAGGQELGALTLAQLAGALALPLIGAGSGALGGITFSVFARR
jgi:hypothetical protein